MQNGVARTNCIDCLDRTNAAQFVIGKRALGHQLHALGIINETCVDYDTDAVNLFTHMYVILELYHGALLILRFHDHGDTIAVQYGGSHLVNTMETYRKINQWTSHSRDMVESFKRYYNNSFLDGQRQEAYNLFLGNYIFAQGQPMLWDLSTDYYLHHSDPRAWSEKRRPGYINWYTPAHLAQKVFHPSDISGFLSKKPANYFDDFWLEYYRPLAVSSFQKIFSFRMNSPWRYIPFKSTQEGKYDLSPFRVRVGAEPEMVEKKKGRKGVTIVEPQDGDSDATTSHLSVNSRGPAHRWLHPQGNEKNSNFPSIMKETSQEKGLLPSDKGPASQWTLDQFVKQSLDPAITATEAEEYRRYISHPLSLPLVASTETPPNPNLEFLDYVRGISPDAMASVHYTEDDLADYTEFLTISDDPLTVTEADAPKKRYKAYRQWLKGKSLFKQQRVEQ